MGTRATVDAFQRVFAGKTLVLAVMAHPDDLAVYCGGTFARLVSSGVEVACVRLTNGGKGTRQVAIDEADLSQLRSRESEEAANIIGIAPYNNVTLNVPDGAVEADLPTIMQVAEHVRRLQPGLIIAHNPEHAVIRFAPEENWISHRDHRHAGQLALDAAYPYSRDIGFSSKQVDAAQREYSPTTEFLMCDYYDHPDVVQIDVSEFIDVKLRALSAHTSQMTRQEAEQLVIYLNRSGERYFETFRYVIAE